MESLCLIGSVQLEVVSNWKCLVGSSVYLELHCWNLQVTLCVQLEFSSLPNISCVVINKSEIRSNFFVFMPNDLNFGMNNGLYVLYDQLKQFLDCSYFSQVLTATNIFIIMVATDLSKEYQNLSLILKETNFFMCHFVCYVNLNENM